ncbi:MAG TPA: 30S ribosomal protein S17 [Candidatus Altiarchaeales archaeon]|nr:30S ribosomal protein S17 [Candidatus Altiarchaeales archaeon]
MEKECADVKCPIHGSLSTRGQVFEGIVVSDKMQSTVVVEMKYSKKVRKYGRYMHASSRISAHNPPCISAKTGDTVKVMECRKLSKTVAFTVVEKMSGQENKTEKPKKKAVKKSGKKKAVKKTARKTLKEE